MVYLIILAVYSLVILLFVPLGNIEKIQKWIHKQARKVTDKLND